jgi:hypothetical protein
MGCMMWMLSKSDEESYKQSKKVTYEAYKASEFLMNPPNDILKTCYSTCDDNTDCQFVIRENPKNKKELMLMCCNNKKESTTIEISIPSNYKIDRTKPLVFGYKWMAVYLPESNSVRMLLPGFSARSFILTVK